MDQTDNILDMAQAYFTDDSSVRQTGTPLCTDKQFEHEIQQHTIFVNPKPLSLLQHTTEADQHTEDCHV